MWRNILTKFRGLDSVDCAIIITAVFIAITLVWLVDRAIRIQLGG